MINKCFKCLQNVIIDQQLELNDIYWDFCNAVQEQTDITLTPKIIYIRSGPKRSRTKTRTDINKVLDCWKTYFETLLNPGQWYTDATSWTMATPPPEMPIIMDTGLDQEISILEICKALAKAKHGKAVGCDGISVEVRRNDEAMHFLHTLFDVCFYSGCIPDVWYKGIINPIPNNSVLDPKD